MPKNMPKNLSGHAPLEVPLLAALLALATSACATTNPCLAGGLTASSTATAALNPYQTKAPDMTCLQAFEWNPKTASPRGVVVVVHGVRDHAYRYDVLAQALTKQGLAVYAQDHRGHGQSGGDRQRFDSVGQLVEDVDVAVSEAQRRNPNVPVFLYGHSLGGLVATQYALAHGEKLRGVVLSGAALKLMPSVGDGEKAAARFFSGLIPGLPAQRLDDSEFVREPAEKAALAADPLIHHENLPARSAAAGLDAIEDTQRRMEQVKVPLLILHGGADKATNLEGSRELYARAGSTDKTLKIYDGVFHDLMHEPEHDRIIQDVTEWITQRMTPKRM